MKKCKTGSMKGGQILVLPVHLIYDILSRLTVETIFSCKCVCKLFLKVLTDPYFAELHLTKAPNIDDGLIIQDRKNISDMLLVHNYRPQFEKPGSVRANRDSSPCQTLTMPTKATQLYNKDVYIVGSCNGLFCLRYSEKLYSYIYYICNPILGEFLALPPHIQHEYCEYIGFGFCPKTKQYKVLRFVTPSICSMFTLGTNHWTQVLDAPYPRTIASFDSSLDGNLHWITSSTKTSNLICMLNLETEQFSYILPPARFNQDVLKKVIYLFLGLVGGSFGFCYNLGVLFEVYVMKDYGPEGNWTKKFSVDLSSSNVNLQAEHKCFLILGLLNNGELVLQCNFNTLVCYDLRKETPRYMLAEKNVTCFNVLAFVPSFISIKDIVGASGNVEVVQRKIGRNLWSEDGLKFIR